MLPAAASLQKQGANKGAIASFLVSTPESGIDSIAVTYALLDPLMTVVRPLAAFVTGISTGFAENIISFKKNVNTSAEQKTGRLPHLISAATVKSERSKKGFLDSTFEAIRYGCIDIWGDIALWFFAGLLIAGIITVIIPEDLSTLVLGGGFISMLTMLLIGMPLYICATASTPVAAALLLKGASPGAVLVFLLAGPVTNMTSLSVLVKILGKAGTVRYFLVIACCSLGFGVLVDWLYQLLNLEPRTLVEQVRETIPDTVKLLSATILLGLSSFSVYTWTKQKWQKEKGEFYRCGFPELHPVPHKHSSQKRKAK